MKQRILKGVAALMCTLILFSAGIAPAHAYAPPSGGGDASVQAEEIRIYYRVTEDGVREMRIWSLTYGRWLTAWVPVDP